MEDVFTGVCEIDFRKRQKVEVASFAGGEMHPESFIGGRFDLNFFQCGAGIEQMVLFVRFHSAYREIPGGHVASEFHVEKLEVTFIVPVYVAVSHKPVAVIVRGIKVTVEPLRPMCEIS